MTAALPSAVTGEFRHVPRRLLARSRTNPRTTFDPQKLSEMARTIADHGIVEPILARPLPGVSKHELELHDLAGKPLYEIVAGERRWRAAELAKLLEVPVIIRNLTDKQALEIQTIENAQREDLTPLEQADGYERLIKEFGYTPEKIADAIGKSRAHVFQIRKLRSLSPKLREAFAAGEMDTTLATVFARVPGSSMQEQAWTQIKKEFPNGFSFRIAADFVRKNYMLDLARAPFPIADATLHPKAGPCGECPKRTGNQADLFPDVKNGNVCTDPQCFNFKRAAHQQRTVQKLEEKGTVVITGQKAKAALPYDWSDLKHPEAGLVDPNARCYDDEKSRSYGALAKLAGVELAQLQDPRSGDLRPVVQLEPLRKALVSKGVKLDRSREQLRDPRIAEREKAKEQRARLLTEARRRTWLGIRDKVTRLDFKDLATIAAQYWTEIWSENQKRVLEAWSWPQGASEESIQKRISQLKPAALARFLVDLALVPEIPVKYYQYAGLGAQTALLKKFGARHGVSLDRITAQLDKEAKLKKAAKAAAAKKKAVKAPGKVTIKKTDAKSKAKKK